MVISTTMDESEMMVDAALTFAGPTTKKLSHAKNVLRQRCFLLAWKLHKALRRVEYLEDQNGRKDSQVADYCRLLNEEEAAAENRVSDLRTQISNLRKDKNKLHEDVQAQIQETKKFEELYTDSQAQIIAVQNELKFLRSEGIDRMREDLDDINKKTQQQIARQFAEQKELLEREVAHYKKKCVQIESAMRQQSEEEKRKMALDIQQERKAKVAEQMKRAFGGVKADQEKSALIQAAEEADAKRKAEIDAKEREIMQINEKRKSEIAELTEQRSSGAERSTGGSGGAEEHDEPIDESAIIEACERKFEEERRRFHDQLEEQKMLYDTKDVNHRREMADLQEKMNQTKEEMRSLQKLVKHYQDIERVQMRTIKQEKEHRMTTLKKVTQLATLAKEEGLGVLQKIDNKEEWANLKHRSSAVYNPTDPTHRMVHLLTGAKTMRTPKLDPTLLEDKTPIEQEWSVFGEIRELNQALSDCKANPIRPADETLEKPLYPPSFEFEELYKDFAHNEQFIAEQGIGYIQGHDEMMPMMDEAAQIDVSDYGNFVDTRRKE